MRFNRSCPPVTRPHPRIYTVVSIAFIISTASAALMNVEDSSEFLASDRSAIRYQVGNPHFEGQTVVVIRGDASVTVDFIQGTDKKSYQGQLEPARFQQIVTGMIDPRQITSSGRDPVPDEAEIEIHLVVSDRIWQLTFRDRDRWTHPDLQKDIDLFESVAREVSHGAVPF